MNLWVLNDCTKKNVFDLGFFFKQNGSKKKHLRMEIEDQFLWPVDFTELKEKGKKKTYRNNLNKKILIVYRNYFLFFFVHKYRKEYSSTS